MSESEQLEGASKTGAEAGENPVLAVETGGECDIGTSSNSSASQQVGNGCGVANTMVHGSKDSINSTSENEAGQPTMNEGSLAIDPVSSSIVEAPRVGMVFGTWEDIDKYYRQYGMQQGFGVIKPASGFKGKNKDVLRNTTWRCECWGKPDNRRENKRRGMRVRIEDDESSKPSACGRPRKSKKCDCTAMVYATARPDGSWVLKKVVLEHKNHDPTPNKSNDPKISPYMKKRLFTDMMEGLDASQIQYLLANDRAGLSQVFQSERISKNSREGKLKLGDGDMNALLKFFMRMHQEDQRFLHFMRHDDSGYLKDVFWVDARNKAAYEEFGDVVYFDSIYFTNDYAIPLVKFVGVNHHGQMILFGCALISQEDFETYEWVFKTWLLCMNGREPLGILTDQAPSIGIVLDAVMPNTTHRWCAWHIVRQFPTKLGTVPRYHELDKELKNTIYYTYSDEEFDRRWTGVINEYQLQGNEWLQCLFEERHMWAPAYTNHIFWAGMNSIERAHTIHSIFDGTIGKHTRLSEFLELYCFVMEERVKIEKDADDDCTRYLRGASTHFTVEKLYQKIYTDAKFRELQIECQRVLYCNSRSEKFVSDTLLEYVIQDRVWLDAPGKRENIPTDEKRIYHVRYNTSTNEFACECKLFQSNGILCRHGIRLYDLHSVSIVPENYILRRWRKDIKRKHTKVKVAYYDPTGTDELKRYDRMRVAFEAVCSQAAMRDDTADIVFQSIADMKLRVEECLGRHCVQTTAECNRDSVPCVRNEHEDETMNGQRMTVQNGDVFCQDLNMNGWSRAGHQ